MNNISFVVVSLHGKIMDVFCSLADAESAAERMNAARIGNMCYWADEYPTDALRAEFGE